jgi:hypothetical protein
MNLKEPMGIQSNGALILNKTARKFRSVLGARHDEGTLLLGAHPRPKRLNPQKHAKQR